MKPLMFFKRGIEVYKKEFKKKFDDDFQYEYFSPGRVNLIGEHIDYNGGNVLPMAIDYGTYGYIKMRDDKIIRAYSKNFDEVGIIKFSLNDLVYEKEHDWVNYIKGVCDVFQKTGYEINNGFDILINGTIPNSSGLSSSASLEVLIGRILIDTNKLNIQDEKLAVLCQRAENEFIGVNCGIMDQFIIACAKENTAMLLNTSTLGYECVNLDFGEYELIVLNSKKKRGLVDSAYNQRRTNCELALEKAKKIYQINDLCELTMDEIKNIDLTEIEKKRVQHVVSEQQRVNESVNLLKSGNIIEFAKLLTKSHISLKDDFEVSCDEVDFLVEKIIEHGAIGARMTGAGFGGCAIALIDKDKINELEEIKKLYKNKFDLDMEYYEVKATGKAYQLK